MENRAKFRFPRALLSTLTSCRTQNLLSDVIHNHHNSNPLYSSSASAVSSSFEPLLPPPASPVRRSSFDQMVRESCVLPGERNKVCGGHAHGRRTNSTHWRRTRTLARLRKERSDSSGEDWFSSDDEREDDVAEETETETETMFSSSRSFLSLSSDPDSIGSARTHTRRRPPSAQRREARRRKRTSELEEKVKGSFAVVKRSRDPYSDFRTSMVEMIMEKQIFGAKELQQLLECFLSLNPTNHHRIIFEVFAEICDALFSDLC